MKKMNRLFTLALALIMILSLAAPAFAADPDPLSDEHSHTVTIDNHRTGYEYTAYQIFKGKLSSTGILSDMAWGESITNPEALLAALAATDAFAGVTSVSDVAAKLSSATAAIDDPIAMAFASVAGQYIETNAIAGFRSSSYNDSIQKYEISNLPDGYYLIMNTGLPQDDPETPDVDESANTTYSRYVLEVLGNITVKHKGTFPTVEKKIVEGEAKYDASSAGIGKVVNYEITGTMPSNLSDYRNYFYKFEDQLSKGLTYNLDENMTKDGMTVTVNGYDVTEHATIVIGEYNAVTGTNITVTFDDLLKLDDDTDPETEGVQAPVEIPITAATKVILTYNATVNENAIVGTAIPNDVRIIYSNDPNFIPPTVTPEGYTPPTGITPWDRVVSYFTELTILKYDGAMKSLEGAEFELKGEMVEILIVTKAEFTEVAELPEGETAYYKMYDGKFTDVPYDAANPEHAGKYDESAMGKIFVKEIKTVTEKNPQSVTYKAFVGTDGYLTFTGLMAGEYTLTETTTPEGYNSIQPISFTITFDRTTCEFDVPDSNLIMVETDNTLYTEIKNTAGNVLPSTGGIGTTMFYLFGSMMVVSAGVLLITKKRMAA